MLRLQSGFMRPSLLALAITSAFSGAAFATTDTLTVTATGNPRSAFEAPMMVSVIDTADPENQTAASAADLLHSVPGITLSGTGRTNGQDVNLRGYDRRGVLVLVDGVRQGTDTGHLNSTFLDPALIKRVEIVRGPSALLYGSGALGGVIAYNTVNASDLLMEGRQYGFRVFGTGGTGDHSLGMGASAFGRTDNLDGLIAWSSRDRGDLRQGDGSTAPNDESINNMLAKGTWKIDGAQALSGSLRYYNNAAQEPKNPQEVAATSASNPMTDRSTIQRDMQLSYKLAPQGNDWLSAESTVYWSEARINAQNLDNTNEYSEQTTKGGKVENRSRLFTDSFASHLLTYGGEYYRQEQKPGGATTGFPEAKIDFSSGWLQDEITLRDLPVTLLGGTRYDNYRGSSDGYADVDADKWSSRAGMTISPIDWLMLFGSYAQAFRAPTMGEMYNDSKHFSIGRFYTNYWVPNPNLRPETNATQEYGFGLRFDNLMLSDDALEFKASYFDTNAKDYISTTVDFAARTTMSYNVPNAKIWGWDVMTKYTADLFSLDLAYNRTRGKNTDTGEYISSINPDTVTSKLNIPLAHSGFSVGWIGTFANRSTHVSSQYTKQPGYAVNDFYVSYQGQQALKGMTTTLVLGNAFDKAYWSPQGIPQDGRNGKIFVSYQW
ncbi:TPA_asm: TonB-dependent hemoglobin/transferrin/lactoferrin family receptor [Salmonella enterica subsp. houtenae serovar 16:z4,z32:-]|uniref:TonB-dependent hemoglobin/transferrin/lactoferrin family receptor n=1 Tax=Salmonella enterica subsp. houtenae serovar 16:z4,z32:- TaxID=1307497 RepID=A0A735KPU8_SALHO|nr:TonB-dependent hemoglobin/transferrin/lactoferrin family receptor [Salmonella enterica]ECE6508686.1 TonB-dependent hemoglobin/transferrin/lactoferrin family receptor [Salmonella enterica subsp. houtenae]EDS7538750.1 TonB-dependent hemoglobin/transferrin/lactoferrin family receptor [Salmonella enterica subsp. enterica]EGI6408499.1 TonB-dependent hemoglobin/transferrin/lactoferrin family receptor [Salmonella enterica subsp. houtenae serovar 16:z4,z32:-]ENZ84352.1 TonB-dependent hemin [Salmonel